MNSLESFVKFIPTANNAAVTINAVPILTDMESKARRFTSMLNDSLYENSNEPSLGLYRIQEHVRKTIPSLIEKKSEMEAFGSKVKGNTFDLDYSVEAVQKITDADPALQSIKDLLTDSLYAARQLNIKKSKLESNKSTSSHSSPSATSNIKNSPSLYTNLTSGTVQKKSEN